jgi:hypothetical protein
MSKCEDIKCPKTKICNPSTGRCVLKSGKIGKQLQKKRSRSRRSSRSSRSRSSRRYRSSRLSRLKSPKNIIQHISRSRVHKRADIKKYGKEVAEYLSNYTKLEKLGEGSYGEVLKGCLPDGKC